MPPIKTLPILERWECAGCARCCHGSLIWLERDDLEKLRQQKWEDHPDFRGTRVVVREGWWGGRHRLAQREDGACVFLLEDGRCRIHAEFGGDAKPLVCRMFPLQLVPQEKHSVLTVRRSCPTAAADQGLELTSYQKAAREMGAAAGVLDAPVRAPAITRRYSGQWSDVHAVTTSLERLVTDSRFPLVRRLAHAVHYCELLEECRLRRLQPAERKELYAVLESGASDVGDMFAERSAPSRAAAALFRQIGAEYLRLHHSFVASSTWRQRCRMAMAAWAMARGKGAFPPLHPGLPRTTFSALERPLGHLEESVQRPFLRFFEAQVLSRQFAIAARPHWTVVESFRALAVAYPVGLWLLRLLATDRSPTAQDAIDVVTMLDRGQGYAPQASRHHRSRIATLARLDELERLVAWYAR